MPVQLPDNFFIPEQFCSQVIQTTPMKQRSAFARNRLEMPIRRRSEREIAKPKQIKRATNYLISSLYDLARRLWPAFSKLGCRYFRMIKCSKEGWLISGSKVVKQVRNGSRLQRLGFAVAEQLLIGEHPGPARPATPFNECGHGLSATHSQLS